jgi:Complex I intermediate-associated protein 30 (CIA30)
MQRHHAMKSRSVNHLHFRMPRVSGLVLAACVLMTLGALRASDVPALLDDFSNPDHASAGAPRILVDDSSVGGKSSLRQSFHDGILSAEGEIAPARGQPGWVSLVLPLAAPGEGADLSQYEGVRLRVRVKQGTLSVSANSTEVDNFDYHAGTVARKGDGIAEVRIAFKDMKRAWSEQTPLNPATINSISIVAAGLQPGAFAYELDEIGFY